MKVAFTICSNNYLSQAKILGDSLAKYNPDYKFIIGLCDKKNDSLDYTFLDSFEIIEVEELNIANFEWMIYNYNIIELNTSVKPFYFKHILQKYKDADIVIYFDPDIKVFNNLSCLEKEIENKSALITPHILSPIPLDHKLPEEKVFLNFGIYNLGFLAINRSDEAMKLLAWWSERLSVQSFDRVFEGLFVDQLPMNFAPIFFEHVCVSKTPGYNFAYWNFHERKLSEKDGTYFVNNSFPLTFFHFSSFNPAPPLTISRYQNRFRLEDDPILHHLYSEYAKDLTDNKYFELKKVICYYTTIRDAYLQEERLKMKKESGLMGKIRNLPYLIYNKIIKPDKKI